MSAWLRRRLFSNSERHELRQAIWLYAEAKAQQGKFTIHSPEWAAAHKEACECYNNVQACLEKLGLQ